MQPICSNPPIIGTSDFDEIIAKDALFIDKSLFIKEFMNDKFKVVAILRPRRFGKSTNLSMLKSFLSLNAQPSHFERYLIGKETDFVEKHCGQYPVVMLDLKDCKGDSWEEMYRTVWLCIRKMVLHHEDELKDAIALMSRDMDFTRMTTDASQEVVSSTLNWLTLELHKKYGKCVIVLVDEYDAPLNHAFRQGYYDKASKFFGLLYSRALKGNSALEKACLMGIVEVEGAGILSGLNNVQVYSVADTTYSAFFGFSMDEIDSLVVEASIKEEIQYWYNGYNIGNQLLINPWSFMCWYARQLFKSYWSKTSYTETIATILKPHLKISLMNLVPLLCDNKKIQVSELSSQVNYSKKDWDMNGIVHFLIHTGYLTYCFDDTLKYGEAWIPNNEIRSDWESSIKELFREQFDPLFKSPIQAILTAHPLSIPDLQELMQNMLLLCSSHDVSKQYENSAHVFYFGAFLAILHDGTSVMVTSNIESGHGRHDIRIRFVHLKRAFIFEFKLSKYEANLNEDAKAGLQQIIDKNYAADLSDGECFLVGVAFHRKKLSELAFKKIQV